MGLKKEEIFPIKTSLHTFNGAEVKPLGIIVLPIYAADRVIMVKFLVVDTPSSNEMSIPRWSLHDRYQRGSITKSKMLYRGK